MKNKFLVALFLFGLFYYTNYGAYSYFLAGFPGLLIANISILVGGILGIIFYGDKK